jgi:hypothetical protein
MTTLPHPPAHVATLGSRAFTSLSLQAQLLYAALPALTCATDRSRFRADVGFLQDELFTHATSRETVLDHLAELEAAGFVRIDRDPDARRRFRCAEAVGVIVALERTCRGATFPVRWDRSGNQDVCPAPASQSSTAARTRPPRWTMHLRGDLARSRA